MRPAAIPLDARTRWPDARITSMVFVLDPPPNTTPTIGAAVLVETGDREPTFRVPWKPTREEITALDEGAHMWLTIRANRMPLVDVTVDTIEPVPLLTGLCDCHTTSPVDVDEHCAAGVHCTISNHVCAEDRANRDHQAACCNCRRPLDMLVAVAS